MTKNDLASVLGGTPRRISEQTMVWESKSGHASPMTPLEKRMWETICSLTNK
jgi:hypothetical protein